MFKAIERIGMDRLIDYVVCACRLNMISLSAIHGNDELLMRYFIADSYLDPPANDQAVRGGRH